MFSPACTPCTLSAEYPVRTALPARIIPAGQGGRTDSRLLLRALISAPTANRATVAKNSIMLIFIILRFNSGIQRPVPRGYPTSNSLWPGTTVRKGNKNTRKTARLTAGKTAGRHKGPDIRARNTKNRTRHAYFQAAGRIVRLFLLSLLG